MAELESRVLGAIRRIVHAVDRHSKSVEKIAGATLPQLVVLATIRTLGEVTTGKLSAAASLSPATVTTVLDNLEARGLIERYRGASDRRVVHSRLTARGSALLDAAPPFLHEHFVSRFARLDALRQAEIVAAIEAVADMMGAPYPAEALPAEVPLEAGLVVSGAPTEAA